MLRAEETEATLAGGLERKSEPELLSDTVSPPTGIFHDVRRLQPYR